mmetsp:Transcript_45534/g.145201  ORF Transcript_45534/g.145201 Transcript_45534/m.145201 type:complete len:330 (+) Transcript_45534:639-1628(+)
MPALLLPAPAPRLTARNAVSFQACAQLLLHQAQGLKLCLARKPQLCCHMPHTVQSGLQRGRAGGSCGFRLRIDRGLGEHKVPQALELPCDGLDLCLRGGHLQALLSEVRILGVLLTLQSLEARGHHLGQLPLLLDHAMEPCVLCNCARSTTLALLLPLPRLELLPVAVSLSAELPLAREATLELLAQERVLALQAIDEHGGLHAPEARQGVGGCVAGRLRRPAAGPGTAGAPAEVCGAGGERAHRGRAQARGARLRQPSCWPRHLAAGGPEPLRHGRRRAGRPLRRPGLPLRRPRLAVLDQPLCTQEHLIKLVAAHGAATEFQGCPRSP